MNLRAFLILAAVAMALTFAAPVIAAPSAQASVDEVIVTSTTTFTVTVQIDEVTTVAIPLQVDWLAEGPTLGATDEVSVTISPTILRQGFFSVTVSTTEPTTGALAITITEPVDDLAPLTGTVTTTDTTPTTTITTTEATTETVGVPVAGGATANTIANLRAGPGTDFAVVGSAEAGSALEIVGQNADGTWFILANGSWIAAFLVDNAPADLPLVEPTTATPLPTPTTSAILSPTAIPLPTPTLMPTVTPTVTPTP